MSEIQYGELARVYDSLNSDIDYAEWADFIEKCFEKYSKKKPSLVLDLACGTGTMTLELARRGYDMIAIDLSEDMLSEAIAKSTDKERKNILFLRQNMRNFELYGTVDATVCILDSINYLTEAGALAECFSSVHNYLNPDGLFIFDVNSPYKFEKIYADNSYILESELDGKKIFCGWQNFYNKKTKMCDFYISTFEEENGKYRRFDEHQRERMYTEKTLRRELSAAGFELVMMAGGYDFGAPTDTSERWYIAARAKKGTKK